MTSTVSKLQRFWDTRYGGEEYAYGVEPNEFLVRASALFPQDASILCLADGEGRNGVWLASQGWKVTSVDISPRGLEKARSLAARRGVCLATREADLAHYDLGLARWDVVVSVFLHLPPDLRRRLHQRCVAALKPGGVMAFTAYAPGQLGRGTGGPAEVELLAGLVDLEQEFAGCRWIWRYMGERDILEGRLHSGLGEVVEAIVQKPSMDEPIQRGRD